MTDTRPCGRGEQCADPVQDAASRPGPRWGPGPFCHRDTQLVDDALAELPSLFNDLADELRVVMRSSGGGPVVSGTREHSSPLDLGVDALRRSMLERLVTWYDRLYPGSPLTRPVPDACIGEVCRALRVDLGVLLRLSRAMQMKGSRIIEAGGTDAGNEILSLRFRARKRLGVDHPVEARPAPCAACGAYGLTREAGSGVSRCEVCGRVMSEDEYQTWVNALVDGMP